MGKKQVLTAAFTAILLMSAVAGTLMANWVRANPFEYPEVVSVGGFADSETEPPTVSIISPTNYTSYPSDSVSLTYNFSVGDSSTASYLRITEITMEADWLPNNMTIGIEYDAYKLTGIPEGTRIGYNTCMLKLTDVPEGTHRVVVHARENGYYLRREYESGCVAKEQFTHFSLNGSSSIFFTVDLKPPSITVLSVENKTYSASDVPLTVVTDELLSQMAYSVDGQENVTIGGNSTLTNLSSGEHNLTVYGTDLVGHAGASETIYFNVEVPFPTQLVVASAMGVIFVGLGLIVYFKKRKH